MEAAKARALALVGQGYIYGARGQTCSPAFRRQQAAQYPDQANYILDVGAKWDGCPVWDCAQLTRTVAAAAGGSLPSGATSQWNKGPWVRRGTIDTLPQGELVFLYRRQNGSTTVMAHTGVALGDGTCVHARGTAYGVVRQDMAQHAWTHWADLWAASESNDSEVEKVEPLYRATVVAESGSTVRVRAEPGGRVIESLKLGTEVDVLAEAAGWYKIAYGNGKNGYMASAFLCRVGGESLEGLAARVAEIEKRLDAVGI